ncbi:hypothetical protein HY251_17845, partial [bacterium]|nr:hypothetical protein [bacterium]
PHEGEAEADSSADPREKELRAVRLSVAQLRADNDSLRAEVAEAKASQARLATENAALMSQVRAAREAAGTAHPKPGEKNKLAVNFAHLGEIEALRKANWKECGEAVQAMLPVMKHVLEKLAAGEQLAPGVQNKIRDQNMKLAKLALELADKLPTEAGPNGAFTHPIVLANIMASHLDASGKGLSDAEIDEVNRLGESFNEEWTATRGRYTEATLKLEKIADELDLKRTFVEKMIAVLTADQKALVVDPATHGIMGVDLYSPALLLQGLAYPVSKTSTDDLKTAVVDSWLKQWELDASRRPQLETIGAAWVSDNSSRLSPVPEKEGYFYSIDDALVALRATVKAGKEAQRTLAPGDDALNAIRDANTCLIPRLVKAP